MQPLGRPANPVKKTSVLVLMLKRVGRKLDIR